MKQFARRIGINTDLKAGIQEMVEHYKISAGAVMMATGVLASIRLQLKTGDIYTAEGAFIINSCTGTAAMDQINIQLDVTTNTGGNLAGLMLDGCYVSEPVELVVGAIDSTVQ